MKQGFTLIEIIIYIGLLGVIAVFLANSMIQIATTYHRVRTEREVLLNARLLLETLNRSIAQAQDVYTPTSRFNVDNGQLSLITPVGAQPEHSNAYADYWADNQTLWMRQEGSAALPISASSVRISQFRLEHILQGVNREAVRVTLALRSASSKFIASTTLYSTTALRGNY